MCDTGQEPGLTAECLITDCEYSRAPAIPRKQEGHHLGSVMRSFGKLENARWERTQAIKRTAFAGEVSDVP